MFRQRLIATLLFCVESVAYAEMRDPTRPANLELAPVDTATGVSETGEVLLTLTEIRISGSDRRAIINGELVMPGQTLVDGTEILSIRGHSVIVKQNGVNKKLTLVQTVKHSVK